MTLNGWCRRWSPRLPAERVIFHVGPGILVPQPPQMGVRSADVPRGVDAKLGGRVRPTTRPSRIV